MDGRGTFAESIDFSCERPVYRGRGGKPRYYPRSHARDSRPARQTYPSPPPVPPPRQPHPLEQAVKEKIAKVKLELQAKEQEYKSLTQDLRKTRLEVFKEQHHCTAEEVMRSYTALVNSCLYQGGVGYRSWLPRDNNDHMVIHPDKYQRAQPTQMEKDAYYAIYGTDMVVTTEQHFETYGN